MSFAASARNIEGSVRVIAQAELNSTASGTRSPKAFLHVASYGRNNVAGQLISPNKLTSVTDGDRIGTGIHVNVVLKTIFGSNNSAPSNHASHLGRGRRRSPQESWSRP